MSDATGCSKACEVGPDEYMLDAADEHRIELNASCRGEQGGAFKQQGRGMRSSCAACAACRALQPGIPARFAMRCPASARAGDRHAPGTRPPC